MHVALAVPHLLGGGAERTTVRIARGLLERGHRVDLLVLHDGDAQGYELPEGARLFVLKPERGSWFRNRLLLVRVFGLPAVWRVSGTLLRQSRAFATYLNRENPDCILPSLPKMKVAAFIARHVALKDHAIIPIMHSNLLHRGRNYQYLYSIVFPSSDRVVAVSEGVSGDLIQRLGLPQDLVERIYNPVVGNNLEELVQEDIDHPWLHDGGPPIVLAAGRLARVKDFPTLLRAFAKVADTRPVRLVVLGDGGWRRRLEKLARKLKVADKVWFCGWVTNPFPFMRQASVFVLSSRYEGLGNVLIEALACGCPCISTDCPYGPAEILQNGRFGPLVRVGDAEALAQAIEQLLEAPPDQETLRTRGQAFGVDEAIERYERLIRDVVGERRANMHHG